MASNVIDSLVVLFGLDASNFKKGQKEVRDDLDKTGKEAEKQRKLLEAEQKKVADAYGKVRDSILGVAAAVVTAVAGGEFLAYLTKNDAAVGRLSKNLGIASEELSIWEGIFSRMGSSSGDADGMFRGINKILEDIKNTGGSDALTPLARVGLDIGKFAASSTTATQRVEMLSTALKKLTPQDAQYFAQQAGMSESAVNVLIQQRYALDDLIAEQTRMNVISKEDVELANERQKAWGDFTQTLEGLARKIANEFSPIVTGALVGLKNLLLWMEEHVPVSIGLIGGLGSALLLLKGYSIASMASAFTGNIAAMAASVGGLLGSLGMLTGAGAAGWLAGTAINSAFGLDDKISSWFAPDTFDPKIGTGKSQGSSASSNALFGSLESQYKLPPGLLDQMWRQESGRGTNMRSKAGAKGHFQFMDATAKQYGLSNPDDLNSSAGAAARYMHDLLSANGGDISKALAAYNEGQGNLNKGLMPAETRNYVASIMGGMNRSNSGSGSSNITTGDIYVTTSASTMTGMAHDVGKTLSNYTLVSQANPGLN